MDSMATLAPGLHEQLIARLDLRRTNVNRMSDPELWSYAQRHLAQRVEDEPAGDERDEDDERAGRQQSAGAAGPERGERGAAFGEEGLQQQRGDEVAGEDEEHVDAQEPAGGGAEVGVVEQHGDDGQGAHAFDVGPEAGRQVGGQTVRGRQRGVGAARLAGLQIGCHLCWAIRATSPSSGPLSCVGELSPRLVPQAGRVRAYPLLASLASLARVAEWQTQRTQNPPVERSCGFESHLGHRNPTTFPAVSNDGPSRAWW